MESRKKIRGKPEWLKKLALEQITALFHQAALRFKEDRKLSNKYVASARKLSMKYKVKIPHELKRRMCKHCHKYLVPGVNLRVRTKNGKVVYYCLECKRFMRFEY